jgi:CubicO group peptidase (beta-lactamase class C family)
MIPLCRLTLLLLLLPLSLLAAPQEERMGAHLGYPACESVVDRIECRVGSFSKPHGRQVMRSESFTPLKTRTENSITPLRNEKLYQRLDAYLREQRTTGLLIIKNGEILFERYQYARDKTMQMRSFSMSKTIIALLIGVALEKGIIQSLDDVVEKYYPALDDSAFGATTIRNLLQMSSGVRFAEDYSFNQKSDFFKFNQQLRNSKGEAGEAAKAFRLFNEREYPQGLRFRYSSIETALLCKVLTQATQRTITELTREWLWNPMGAESDAFWLISAAERTENCGGGFYATLRDYGRLGILMTNDGKRDDIQVIPKEFLFMATDASQQRVAFKPRRATSFFGYGFQTWLFPNKTRTFALLGIYGQSLFAQPATGLVMVETGAYELASDNYSFRKKLQLWASVLDGLGGQND